MNRVLSCLSIAVLVSLVSGCQVCQVTDKWSDGVDRVANHNVKLDGWYNPRWDLTREYRPDGGDHWLFRRCRSEGSPCR